MPLSTFQIIQANNDPTGSSFMDATAGTTYLVNELTDIKATVRNQSLTKPWISLVGLQGAGWTGNLAWTFISTTQASIQGDQTVATGTGYLQVGQRVRAFVTAGTIYGQISAVSYGAPNTTVTFIWDAGVLDSGLTDAQTGGDLHGIANNVVTQTQAPLYCAITNSGAAWTGTLTPAISAYKAGQEYRVKWGAASQGSDTVNLNGIGAIAVLKSAGGSLVALAANDIPSGAVTNLLYDGTNFQVTSAGGASGTFDTEAGNPAVTINNSAAETSIYSKSIAGGTIGAAQGFRITALMDFTNASGVGVSFTIKLKFGGTTLCTLSSSSWGGGSPGANIGQRFTADLMNRGVTNAQIAYSTLQSLMGSSGTTQQSGGESAIDTTGAQTLQITATLSGASPNFTLNVYDVVVEII